MNQILLFNSDLLGAKVRVNGRDGVVRAVYLSGGGIYLVIATETGSLVTAHTSEVTMG